MMQEFANAHWWPIQHRIQTIHLGAVLVDMSPNVAQSWAIMHVANPGWNMICFRDVLEIMMGGMYVLVGIIQMGDPDVIEVLRLRDIRVRMVAQVDQHAQ